MVTGASSGIGRQCAVEAARLGAQVVLIGRDRQRLDETLALLEGGPHCTFSQELSQFESLGPLVSEAVGKVGPLFGLVHAAGFQITLPLMSMKPDHYQRLFAVNVIAGFELARLIANKKHLDPNGGSFVFISSVVGAVGERALVGYSASKGAVIAGCRSMALELVDRGVRVNCLLPGQVAGTRMTEEGMGRLPEIARNAISAKHPMGIGNPTDVAGAAMFLLTDAARWITGAAVPVDGGYTAV